jgi:recombinational DNA repair protein RecR
MPMDSRICSNASRSASVAVATGRVDDDEEVSILSLTSKYDGYYMLIRGISMLISVRDKDAERHSTLIVPCLLATLYI